jgi:hypothetical protein
LEGLDKTLGLAQSSAMNANSRVIEIDTVTADTLEREAKARGLSLPDFLAELAKKNPDPAPGGLEAMRASGRGPWSPEALAEDVRAAADFERTGEGIPFDEIVTWMKSWGSGHELPRPKSRRL